MSSNKGQALRELKNFVGMIKNMADLEEEIREAGSIERLIANLKAQADAATSEAAKRKDDLAALDGELASKKAAVDDQVAAYAAKADDAGKQAAKILATAEASAKAAALEADQIVSAAKAKADALVKDANAAVVAAKDDASSIIADAYRAASDIGAETAMASDALSAVKREIDAENVRLAGVKSEIERLKRAFA